MQVTETHSDGLKRQLKVVVGAGEIGARFAAKLDEIKDRVQLKGFRKGKVPVQHLRKVLGRSLMGEVLQQTIEEKSRAAISDRNERPALQPQIELSEDQQEIEKVMSGQADLSFDMSFEVLPQIALIDFSGLQLERLAADVGDEAVDAAVNQLVERSISYETAEGRAAEDGDRVTIDFVGKIDGEPFEGGAGEGVTIVIGQGGFIPGFEEGLKGAKAGDERTVTATFPAEYPEKTLAGKEASFDVKVKEVAVPKRPAVDDEFAKTLGAESLANLRGLVTEQIKREYEQASRAKLKRALLDELEKRHDFALPPSLVERELEGIWRQVTEGLKQAGRTFEDEGKSEEQTRDEYRKIAERRVRLGLVLGEVGEKAEIQVSQEEMRRALVEQARRYPGQERMVYEFYEKNPGAIAELRAPIYEEKVVDFIVEQAKPVDRKVDREELFKPEPEEA
ncbi:MAG: trigger factor [Hyphomicrobiaceae bacterium]|nr:trigger factor [Hyphomicrobiaceae bacterium]